MSDLIDGRVSPSIGNATSNAGGKLLKVVEMQFKYGVNGPGQQKVLMLSASSETDVVVEQPKKRKKHADDYD